MPPTSQSKRSPSEPKVIRIPTTKAINPALEISFESTSDLTRQKVFVVAPLQPKRRHHTAGHTREGDQH